MIEGSEQLNELYTALAKAQGAMINAGKDAKNPHTKSQYATLASAVEATRGPLADNGLCLTQWPMMGDRGVSVVTRIGHSSGQWMQSTISSPLDKQANQVQAVGSTITYLRRYSLMALCGIAPTDDDDGHGAGAQPQSRQRPPASPPPAKPAAKPAPLKLDSKGHDQEWDAVAQKFCVEVGKLGITYTQLADYLQARGEPRPSAIGDAARRDLFVALRGGMADRIKAAVADGGGS